MGKIYHTEEDTAIDDPNLISPVSGNFLCSIKNCGTRTSYYTSMYELPVEKCLKKEWLCIVRSFQNNSRGNMKICQKHFYSNDLIFKNKSTILSYFVKDESKLVCLKGGSVPKFEGKVTMVLYYPLETRSQLYSISKSKFSIFFNHIYVWYVILKSKRGKITQIIS